MEENKKSGKTTVRIKSPINGDNIKVNNKLTEKEIAARRLRKYATIGSFGNRIAASSMYSDIANSSYGNFYSPQLSTDFLEKPQNLRERMAWYRHFYNSNEFVGQAIDLHSTLPLSKIRLERPEGENQEQVEYVYSFFVEMCNELKLFKTLLEISHEYHLFGNCVPGFVDINTSEGIKRADEIEEDDFVLTDKGRYRKVVKKCRRAVTSLFHIKCEGTFQELIVTPEHPVQVLRGENILFVEAKDVRLTDYIIISYPQEEQDITSIHIDDLVIEMNNNLAYLIGFWMGNGILTCNVNNEKEEDFLWELSIDYREGKKIDKIKNILSSVFGSSNIVSWNLNDVCYFKLNNYKREFFNWWRTEFGDITCGINNKKIPLWFVKLPKEKLLNFLNGVIDSERTEIENSVVRISFDSKNVLSSIRDIALKCDIVGEYKFVINENYRVKHGHFKANYYSLVFDYKDFCSLLSKDLIEQEGTTKADKFWLKKDGKIAFKIESIRRNDANNIMVYNFEVEEDHTYSVNGFSTHNCFIYAEDHNPYEMEDETLVKELKEKGRIEAERLYREFKIIDRDPNYKGWRKLIILPLDQVRVKKIQLSDECLIEYVPDPETRKNILSAQQYGSSYLDHETNKYISKIPKGLIHSLQSSGSILLDTDPYSGSYVYHLARKKSQYETLGVSILERCINTLLLQDKLRQAQTQIATRHMTPIRIVWGEGLSDVDVSELREQVDMALVDPDYSIITNYEVHWEEMGSNGRLLELSSEYDHIENSLFAGLGVTRELLTGEGTYAGNRITLEILNTQYLLFRALLQEYVEDYLFKPVAKKKGFIEKDKYGRERLLYPRLSFTRLAIKDNDSFFDQAMQLYQKGSISIDVILDTLNIDPISTKKKIEADLFTTNDFAFNQLISNVYASVAQVLVERYNVAEKLAEYLKLEELPQQVAPEGGIGGLGAGQGGLGRFASADVKDRKQQLDKLISFLIKNPEYLTEILEVIKKKNGEKNKME